MFYCFGLSDSVNKDSYTLEIVVPYLVLNENNQRVGLGEHFFKLTMITFTYMV